MPSTTAAATSNRRVPASSSLHLFLAIASACRRAGVPGKTSTLLAAVARRGFRTVDTDYDGEHSTIAVCGTAENQGRFYNGFEHVIYLHVPLEVLLDRVRARSDNPYGKTDAQQADIATYVIEVEPLIRRGATLELDGLMPVQVLAERVEQCLMSS